MENPPDDSTIAYLWATLKAVEHETVRSSEVCSLCLGTGMRDHLLLVTRSETESLDQQGFAEILDRIRHCWLCRFLCRIVARTFTQEHFASCVDENLPVRVSSYGDPWESDLLLAVDNAARTVSSKLVIQLPMHDNRWRAFADLCPDRVITCHNLNSPASRRFHKHFFGSFSQPTDSVRKVCRWLSLCKTRHLSCGRYAGPSASPYEGFRVLDVNTRTLCEPPLDYSYVALSYVWGTDPFSSPCPPGSGTSLLSDLIRQMNLDLKIPPILPQTIEDAIVVTRNLGQQYLWVDLLCIDQFDPRLKQTAIATMDKIYGRALFTICVLDGSSMFAGIPGVTEPLGSRYQVITDTESERYMFTRFHCTDYVLASSNWARRAWTFQEGELSQRRLCFTESGIFLLCKEEIFHDILELDESVDRIKGRIDTRGIHYLPLGFDLDMQHWEFDTYARMVASYCCRSMTFSSDAYHAIAGAIRRLTVNLSTTFVAALPVHDLSNALLWLGHSTSFGLGTECRRRSDFPSWSWLGWEGPIEYLFWLQESHRRHGRREGVYSLVDRDSNVLYPDAVQVVSSALATFEFVSPDNSTAILTLTTTIARFRVSRDVRNGVTRWRTDHRWQLQDQLGQRIPRGSSYVPETGYNDDNGIDSDSYCCLRLHSSSSAELTLENVEELDFVFLQHWTPVLSEFPPERANTGCFQDELPHRNTEFADTIWTMAIKWRPDGVGERLDILSIPATAWFAAKPQSTVVRIT